MEMDRKSKIPMPFTFVIHSLNSGLPSRGFMLIFRFRTHRAGFSAPRQEKCGRVLTKRDSTD
jgi:hypothetical protein